MFPTPEILGLKLNWFELITALSIFITLVFGRWYFYEVFKNRTLTSVLIPLGSLLVFGYLATYVMAYIEGQTYTIIKNDTSYLIKFGQAKKFLGFIFLIYIVVIIDQLKLFTKRFNKLGDYLSVVVCLFIVLEANACLFDGHGCYGKFTNLPWGMLFLHGSAPTILPVHPTPLYISLSHSILFMTLFYFHSNKILEGKLILVLLLGTSLLNILIEFLKNTECLIMGLNFSQSVYFAIGVTAIIFLLPFHKYSHQTN